MRKKEWQKEAVAGTKASPIRAAYIDKVFKRFRQELRNTMMPRKQCDSSRIRWGDH